MILKSLRSKIKLEYVNARKPIHAEIVLTEPTAVLCVRSLPIDHWWNEHFRDLTYLAPIPELFTHEIIFILIV